MRARSEMGPTAPTRCDDRDLRWARSACGDHARTGLLHQNNRDDGVLEPSPFEAEPRSPVDPRDRVDNVGGLCVLIRQSNRLAAAGGRWRNADDVAAAGAGAAVRRSLKVGGTLRISPTVGSVGDRMNLELQPLVEPLLLLDLKRP